MAYHPPCFVSRAEGRLVLARVNETRLKTARVVHVHAHVLYKADAVLSPTTALLSTHKVRHLSPARVQQ